MRAASFTPIDEELYKRSFAGPYLKCLSERDAEYALCEVHQGVCGEHLGGKALARKILRQGFYWPTMKKEATEFVQKCRSCQVHANVPRQPPVALTSLQGAWPFAQWGIDLLGPLPLASGQRKFIIMTIDYFTKWVEAEPLAKITEENAEQFVWKNIVCRFGIPAIIITDNGTQFTGKSFTKLCEDLKIELRHTAVSHPQSNGQIEVTNRTVLKGLKTRLEDAGGNGWTLFLMYYGHIAPQRGRLQEKLRTISAMERRLLSRSTSASLVPGHPTLIPRQTMRCSVTTSTRSSKYAKNPLSAPPPTNNARPATTTAK
ncbi:hypothetical protein KSP39_PZI013007 [Platanthera zijinensis]|uniref:Integrase catalytic domain-containing protein n=1 Tax=Platanthera zijinensis TaxID=2320716 RepID=A0AAP0G349_9ASPA